MTPYYEDDFATIYHGDAWDVLLSMDPGSVDLVIADPPYGVEHQSGWTNRHHGNRRISGDDGSLDVLPLLEAALLRLKHQRHFYIFGPGDFSGLTTQKTTELIWDKGRPGMGDLAQPWGPAHERITFGAISRFKSEGSRGGLAARVRRGSVLSVSPDNCGQGAKHHPTAKPVLLLRMLIESSSLIGETVLDPFVGCGSTLVAARMEGRRAIGVEIEEAYCEIAAKRLAQGVLDFGGVA